MVIAIVIVTRRVTAIVVLAERALVGVVVLETPQTPSDKAPATETLGFSAAPNTLA